MARPTIRSTVLIEVFCNPSSPKHAIKTNENVKLTCEKEVEWLNFIQMFKEIIYTLSYPRFETIWMQPVIVNKNYHQ
jgi:hypothetical protein